MMIRPFSYLVFGYSQFTIFFFLVGPCSNKTLLDLNDFPVLFRMVFVAELSEVIFAGIGELYLIKNLFLYV